jgi:hypothetical protein
MDDLKKKRQALDWILLSMTVVMALILIPRIFPPEISVSPLLLFGIIFLTNVSTLLIPDGIPKDQTGIFSKIFFLRLGTSTVFAVLLTFIFKLARLA